MFVREMDRTTEVITASSFGISVGQQIQTPSGRLDILLKLGEMRQGIEPVNRSVAPMIVNAP
jgi:hypothetical protein